jgi:methylthioribose-1-phosphate isomerase
MAPTNGLSPPRARFTGVISPIRWADGALELLDQTRLPSEEVWLRCETPEDVADAIRGMAVRGAPAIGIAAAYGLALGAAAGRSFEEVAELLAGTRPTAVNLRWAIERAAATDRSPEALRELAGSLQEAQVDADRRMGELGARLFGSGERVLTHCNAGGLATGGRGTALGVIRTAWEEGRLAEVWVDETRPLLQGSRLTAWELQRSGIPYRVVSDASAGALMARGLVDRVVVGVDRVAANGDVANKIGTYTLAVLAARHQVPFYAAAPLSSIDPSTPTGSDIPIEERDPSEVTAIGETPVAPPGAPAANWAFDVTPHELVTAIITEEGVLEPPYEESIARVINATAPAPGTAPA